MDSSQLIKWQQDFELEAQGLQTEYNSFFLDKKLHENYALKTNENNNSLSLVILNAELPREIEDGLTEIFLKTKPQDLL